MSKVYEVYYCYYKGELVYIGQGIKGRNTHCNSGCSHVYELNRLHFTGGEWALDIKIVKVSNDREEVKRIEKEAIMCFKPRLNTVFTEKGKKRQDKARQGKMVKKDLLSYRDEIVGKHPTDRFIEKYNILCEDFFNFYGLDRILSGDIKLYSVDSFMEFSENRLMYLSRYLRKPKSNYKKDNSPYALFSRALLALHQIDLKGLLHNRTMTDII